MLAGLTLKSTASDHCDVFATFAGTVVSRLPRNLPDETMKHWYGSPHDLKLALQKALGTYTPMTILREEYPVVVGRSDAGLNELYAEGKYEHFPDFVFDRGNWKEIPGCERKPGLRAVILELLTLGEQFEQDTFFKLLEAMGLRYANIEEGLAFGAAFPEVHRSRKDILIPGSYSSGRNSVPLLSTVPRAGQEPKRAVGGLERRVPFWYKGDHILAARL